MYKYSQILEPIIFSASATFASQILLTLSNISLFCYSYKYFTFKVQILLMLGTHSPSMQQRSLCVVKMSYVTCPRVTCHVWCCVTCPRVDTDHVWSTVSGCLWCDHRSVIILWQLGHITISTTHYTYINGPPIVSSLSLILKEYIYLDRVVETWKVFNKLSFRDFLEAVSRGESSQASA